MQLRALILLVIAATPAHAQLESTLAQIRTEGFQRSQVMDTLFYLSDVHGPRLHGTEGFDRAARFSRDRLEAWGLSKSVLESWDSPVPGWTLIHHSVEMLEPSYARIVAYPMAWTPSTDGVVEGAPVLVSIESEEDLEKYRGKLSGAIVLNGGPAPLERGDVPMGRLDDEEIDTVASATDPGDPRDYWEELEEWNKELEQIAVVPRFFEEEGVAAVLQPSTRRRGVVRVSWSGLFQPDENVPTFVVAREQYDRLARLVERNLEPSVRISLTTRFEEGIEGQNVLAELPGADPGLKDEVVLLGAHLDSWHSGTGATDNAAGCAVMMEAMRILQAIDARPRRTIRLGLWGGEEQAYWGSRYHVETHYADLETMELRPDHDRLSAYFNLDTGTGKIRGLYLQGNEAARPILQRFLAPFAYLDATTLTAQNTSGTDHLLFDAVGLPGFTFIQDPLDYDAFTHHTHMDVYDYIHEDDLKQAAVIVAAVAYQTAMLDEKIPRKRLPQPRKVQRELN